MRGGFTLAVFLLAVMALTVPVSAQDGPDADNDGLRDGLESEFGPIRMTPTRTTAVCRMARKSNAVSIHLIHLTILK